MSTQPAATDATRTGVVDVSSVEVDRVYQYARDETEVYFERKGGRTYLVATNASRD